jgi:hypothetical protein
MPHEPIALIQSYDQLIQIVRARVDELGTTIDAVGERAGLADRYLPKVLGPARRKGFGPMSLMTVLQAVGLSLVVVQNPDDLERIKARLPPRKLRRKHEGYPEPAEPDVPYHV